jgi:hypothetical protein
MILDKWQEDVLATEGNICLRSGRQVGKSTVIGLKAARYALENENETIVVISKTERQAGLLFSKILFNLVQIDKKQIKKGKDRPIKSRISLKNGSIIHSLPAGDTGYGIMGFTINLLIADEAAFIPEEVWNSVIPALAITRGSIWLLSTPFLKRGYYYQCFSDPSFTSFHTSSEECPRRDDKFLAHKKATITKAQYTQMYLGEFVDEALQFFPDALIRKCMTINPKLAKSGIYNNFLGVDVARLGGDDTVLLSVERIKRKNLKMFDLKIPQPQTLTETVKLILEEDIKYKYKKIYIDTTGMGWGVFDPLKDHKQTKNKVVSVENIKKVMDTEYGKDQAIKKKTQKEEGYQNLKTLMEQGKIELFKSDEVFASLKSVLFDYDDGGKLKIDGTDTHIAEALYRAALCMKDKSLNIMAFCK